MGKKVERRFDRVELANFLADLSQQLRRGTLAVAGRIWTVPEQLETKIHLKEEDGLIVTKISWQWPTLKESHLASEPATSRAATSFKDVKARLSTSFKDLQRLIMAGTVPDAKVMQDFAESCRTFAALVKPEWQEPMADYLTHLENLQEAVANRQIEAMQTELQALVNGMIICHRKFKK